MNIETRERPIIFSGPMIRALLDGRKTQTRRTRGLEQFNEAANDWKVIRPLQSVEPFADEGRTMEFPGANSRSWLALKDARGISDMGYQPFSCPYGAVGDLLFVREAWQVWDEYANTPAAMIPAEARRHVNYPADGNRWSTRTRPPMFMPHWAARITLEIEAVRAERVQQITCYDIRAEGVSCPEHDFPDGLCTSECPSLRGAYANLWDSLNAKRGYGWDVNHFCWALTFRRITP